ncbi:MAG: LdpA C-terminal domain-containing domain [Spirulinaceae cyanobacterium]
MSQLYYPLNSLRESSWFKLICGASFQHLPAIRNLALAYTLAGADCLDVAADPAVIAAAQEGVEAAKGLASHKTKSQPWLMVSLNDGEDPHFRKAEFLPTECPPNCSRPCESICPAQAIAFRDTGGKFSGVDDQSCYGCGRCLPICPSELIYTRSYVSTPETITPLITSNSIDAVEIHTQVGHFQDFQRLWSGIAPWLNRLKLVAISCPDASDLIPYLKSLYQLISPLPCTLIWQTDGRAMSGDIGIGTTSASVRLAQKVLAAGLPGYIQLAGGTNQHTVTKLKALGLLKKNQVAGIAYGSYARSLLLPIFNQLETVNYSTIKENTASPMSSLSAPNHLENHPDLLFAAVTTARQLVEQLKSPHGPLATRQMAP